MTRAIQMTTFASLLARFDARMKEILTDAISYLFMDNGELMLDGRSLFFYYARGITPAMAEAKPGTGSADAVAARAIPRVQEEIPKVSVG
jgi:hypothetical protein